MDTSIFMDKAHEPNKDDLKQALGQTYSYWLALRDFVFEQYPKATEGWNYPGKKYGWSFRIKDKKRAIIYLLPHDTFFMVAFVFGQKATNHILNSTIAESIKTELNQARVYAEGRGIRVSVTGEDLIEDIKELVKIKMAY